MVTSEETAGPTGSAASTAPTAPTGHPTTFRAVPLPALVAVGFVAVGLSPIAFQGRWWFLLFLLPLALAWWLVRTRTVVDADALRVVSAVGSRRLPWSEVATLRVASRGWVRAVRADGSEQTLTGVRARDLGRVAQASGGRITMPTPEEIAAAREHERELEATRMRLARLREREAEAADAGPPVDESGDTDADRQRRHSADTPDGDGEPRA
ncbi:MAG: hypothetical protein K0S40_2805 [Actinomycetospora sp.]|nr:hypothetical protein [Actinomycetospora sp.]